jgi:ArsR family transcriptional regulator
MTQNPIATFLEPEKLMYAAEMLRVMGHPVRLQIVVLLEQCSELPAGAIQEQLREPQPTVSQHLGKMRSLGLLKSRRSRGQVLYSVAQPQLFQLLNCVRNCR